MPQHPTLQGSLGTAPQGPGPGGPGGQGTISIPDTLKDSLANVNKHLMGMQQDGGSMPPDAVPELQVFMQLLQRQGQAEQQASGGGTNSATPAGLGQGTPASGPPPPGSLGGL